MDKSEIISSILGIVFLLLLIIYSAISSGLSMFLHLLLLVVGISISVLMINKITKSSNSLKSKIAFSFILPFFLFLSIIFFWFLGNHGSIDEKGLITAIIIIPSSLLFALASFFIGLILSLKRKKRKEFRYNLKPFFWIFSIGLLIILILLFYNLALSSLAISTNSKSFCYLLISPYLDSNLFNMAIKQRCLLKISTEESKIGDITCGELENIEDRNSCYRWTAQNRRNIKICLDNVISETDELKYNLYCSSAISYLEDEIYNILKNPKHPDIIYAIKSTPELGIYYDKSAQNKFIPLIKIIVTQGSLNAKKESLEILFIWAGQYSFEEEKRILRSEILPLIQDQPELQEYVDRINKRLNAVILIPSTSTGISNF